MTYSDEVLVGAPFVVDGTRSLRIGYGELARVIGRPIESVREFADKRPEWLGQIAPLYQRLEGRGFEGGDVHLATYFSVGQAVAIAIGVGRPDAENEILEAFNGFSRSLSERVDREVARAWLQAGCAPR